MLATRVGITSDGKLFIDMASPEKRTRDKKGKSLLCSVSDFTALDLETTGLSPECDSIIELAAVRYRDGKPTDRYSQLINSGFSLDEFITKLTGITNDMVRDKPKIKEVLPSFISFLGSDIIVGHNVHFDINFLYDNCEYTGLPAFSNDFIDTMRLAKRMYKSWESYSLDSLICNLNLEERTSHRALNDAELTANAYMLMCADPYFAAATALPTEKKAKDFIAQDGFADEDNPLFGKVCVFTGALERFNRAEAMQIVTDIGGTCGDNVTKKTDFLILGNSDYSLSVDGEKSTKHKKAEKLKMSGHNIEIISENVFYDMIFSYLKSVNKS